MGPRLDGTVRAAIRLAETGHAPHGAGIMITGSAVTAGEARTLLTHHIHHTAAPPRS